MTGTLLISMLCLLGVAVADKLGDFKTAAEKSGCEAIPYSSERGTCKTKQGNKNTACTNFGCERPRVEGLLTELAEKRKNLADARKRSNQAAIPNLEKRIKQIEGDLKRLKAKAETNIGQCDACIEAREDVQAVFRDVTAKVKKESDPALEPYIDKLVAHYAEGAEEHVEPLKQVKKARDNCKWVSQINF